MSPILGAMQIKLIPVLIAGVLITILASCAVEPAPAETAPVEITPAEATTDQHLIALLECDDIWGCDNAAGGIAGSLLVGYFGIAHASDDCLVGNGPNADTRIVSCAHWHTDGSGDQCWVQYSTVTRRVTQSACGSWLADQ